MNRKIYLIIFALILVSTVSAQEVSREQKIEELRKLHSEIKQSRNQLDQLQNRHQKIYENLAFVSDEDAEEAKRIGAYVRRLFPDGILDDLVDFPEGGSASTYSFDGISYSEYTAPSMEFRRGSLEFLNGDDSKDIGLIAGIGGILIETISEKSPEFITLANYKLPTDIKDIKNEYKTDGLSFRNKVAVIVGNTYLVRVSKSEEGDGIFAIKVVRKESDGSIVIFVKKIKDLSPKMERQTNESANIKPEDFQKPLPLPDYIIQQEVLNALTQKGLTTVTVEATTTEVTIRGTVPKGKMAETMQTVTEVAKRKVNNQVTERN